MEIALMVYGAVWLIGAVVLLTDKGFMSYREPGKSRAENVGVIAFAALFWPLLLVLFVVALVVWGIKGD